MTSIFLCNQTSYDANKKIWSGIKTELKYKTDSSVGENVLTTLMRNPEHINQICFTSGKEYTNQQIASWSVSVACYIKKLNLQQCDIIGLCASNTEYVAPLVFGALLAGLTISTLDPSFGVDGIKHTFSLTKPKMMFCDGALYENVKEALKLINLKATIFTMKDHLVGVRDITEFLREPADPAAFEPDPLKLGWKQTAIILCSSGTTGLPKGVCVSHAHLLNMDFIEIIPQDRTLCFSTLYWLTGLFCLIGGGALKGCCRIISDRNFSVEDFFNAIEKHKPTLVLTPPTQMTLAASSQLIKDYNLSSVKKYVCTGSALSYGMVQKMKTFMMNALILNAYGMSEVGSAVSLGISAPNGAIGKLVNNIQVKIVDDDGNMLGPCETGEICIKTKFHWAGYYADKTATKEIYSEDGWIKSGDIGYMGNDGNMYLMDRKKEILKYNNFQFYPTEIEAVIAELPGIVEVCVCGIPDIVSTYLPAAAIVLTADSTLSEKEIYEHVAKRTSHFKHLRGGVYFLDTLPKTASGKNIRREVAKLLEMLRGTKKHILDPIM